VADAKDQNPPRLPGDDPLEAITQLSREGFGARVRRLRLTGLHILQTAVGASLAWWVASAPLVDHDRPFFAPIAAVIALGGGLGQRLPRVVELVVGVAVGVLIADLLVAWIGSGAVQIAVVVALSMAAAVFLGSGAVMVSQAATSAVLVVTLIPPTQGEPFNLDRFVDALIGGGIGLAVGILVLPINPVSSAGRHIDPLLGTLAQLLDDSAHVLASRDRREVAGILGESRTTQSAVDDLHAALEGASEIARIAPVRWHKRGQLAAYLDAANPVDHLSRNLRVLVRHIQTVLQRNEPVPAAVPQALGELAEAIRALRADLDRGEEPQRSRTAAVGAAELATEALDQTGGFAGQVVIAQTRSIAVDVLLATGLSRDDVTSLMPNLPEGPVSYG
jgi:uncharacterized membrane protein YgaE (UPF0421/DUF939 family)